MTDILEEILHDQSDEKKLYYFKKLLPVIIVIVVLVIVVLVINDWYKDLEIKNNQRTGDVLIKSFNITNNQDLTLRFLNNLIKTSNNKVREIASLKQVSIEINNKDNAKAKVLLEKIINNQEYTDITTSYARLVWLSLVIDESNLSNIEEEKFQKYLEYFHDEKQVFWGTITIIKAIWYVKNNSIELAKNTLKKLLISETTPIVKEQAKALLSNLEKQ